MSARHAQPAKKPPYPGACVIFSGAPPRYVYIFMVVYVCSVSRLSVVRLGPLLIGWTVHRQPTVVRLNLISSVIASCLVHLAQAVRPKALGTTLRRRTTCCSVG
jgi:hypothetical protein